MRDQHIGKIVTRLESKKAGKNLQCLGCPRQRVRLLVGHHLQAMLDATQKSVGCRKLIAGGRIDPAVGGKRGQRRNSAAIA